MKSRLIILTFLFLVVHGEMYSQKIMKLEYFGNEISLFYSPTLNVPFDENLSEQSIAAFERQLNLADYQELVSDLKKYRQDNKLDDWLFYQLIRRTAQKLSPKQENYNRYTLFKWFLLTKSGYDATLKLANNQLLFYVQCEENIYNIPNYVTDNKKYVCLNYHDYAEVNFEKYKFEEIKCTIKGGAPFSYKVTHIPEFNGTTVSEKAIRFDFYDRSYDFNVKYNPNIKTIFTNYPVVDYESYFNIPMSSATYASLIPALKTNITGLNIADGIDYLMRFTRYAFLFQPDTKVYGGEKRLSPEQTIISESSDCEDRTALFFYLVKEIYDLPMIVLAYPQHVTIAVKFDNPRGKPIVFNGEAYSICEPTPQKKDLRIGELPKQLRKESFEIAYVYTPNKK